MIRVERVEVAPGVRLHVERRDGDTGQPGFVLVHGLASNLRLWDGVAERLHRAGHPVVALDQRGHGRSDAPEDGYDLETAVADVRAVVRATGLDRPVVAGQSWGGNVVVELGRCGPEGCRGVVGIDGGLIELAEQFASWEACLAALTPPALGHLTPAALRAHVRAANPDFPAGAEEAVLACFRQRPDGRIEPRLSVEHHLRILRALWEHRPSMRLAGLSVPLLLLLADTGDPKRTEAKRRAEARARGRAGRVSSRWFAPAHHDLHLQQPDSVAETLLEHLARGFFG